MELCWYARYFCMVLYSKTFLKQTIMKSWKTTLGGLLAASGIALQTSDNATIKTIGVVLGVVGTLLLGGGAKDNNVTGGSVKQ